MSHKRADIKESTLETKFNIFNKHIFPTFEHRLIDTITDDDIATWQYYRDILWMAINTIKYLLEKEQFYEA